jgi:hypothetical protein
VPAETANTRLLSGAKTAATYGVWAAARGHRLTGGVAEVVDQPPCGERLVAR